MTFAKMNPDHKTTWLEALRGGKYKQGRQHLRKSNGEDAFCCLGVLQDVIQPEDWVSPSDWNHDKLWAVPEYVGWEDDDNQDALHDGEIQGRLLEETGLSGDATVRLITLNDGRHLSTLSDERIDKHSFEQIADWIEENL